MKQLTIILLIVFWTFNITAQKTENGQLTIVQKGIHYENNFLNLKKSSKKEYIFDSKFRISRVYKYGRYHDNRLKLIGEIADFMYQDSLVIEFDSSYCCTDNRIMTIIIDTFSIELFNRKLRIDTLNNVYDGEKRLVQSIDKYNTLKKFVYEKSGLIYRIKYFYKYDELLEKKSILKDKWKNTNNMSIHEIERTNNFILWQHGFGI